MNHDDSTPNLANLDIENNSNNDNLVAEIASLKTEIKTNTENFTQIRKMIEDLVRKHEIKAENTDAVIDKISTNLMNLKINVEILNEKLDKETELASLKTEITTNTENLTQIGKMLEDFVKAHQGCNSSESVNDQIVVANMNDTLLEIKEKLSKLIIALDKIFRKK